MKKIIVAVIVALAVAPQARGEKKKLFEQFRGLFGKFGQNSTTKVKVVSGPTDVKMRNGRVAGKRWLATCGEFRFKITIQDSTGVKPEQVVQRLEKLPMSYMKACQVVSDPTEDGIAVYANLGGAAAHGGQSYINIVPNANALVIAHEAGHTLEQYARSSDPRILDRWGDAIKADKVSVSNYGDKVRHEDLGEFARVYAVCLSAGAEPLAELKKLSPARFALWEEILVAPAPGWPQWRGPNRDGKSSDKGLLKSWPEGGPKLLWKVTGIGQGFSGVSLGGGLIYITGRKEAGDPAKVPEAPHVYKRPGKRLFIRAIDMQGKVKWVKDATDAYLGYYKGVRATPTYHDGKLYLLTGNGEIGCYGAKNGERIWKRHFKEFRAIIPKDRHRFGFSESILVLGDRAIVCPGGNAFMVALDKNTGKTVWKSPKYAPAEHSSTIHVVYKGVPMLINGSTMGLVCVHAETGKFLWTREFAPKNTANVPTPAFSDGYVFWAVGYGKGGICMKLSVSGKKVTAEEAWRTEEMDCHVGGYVIHDGYIYGNHKNGYTCLDLKTGAKKWFEKAVGKGSLCWADDMLYLYAEKDGEVGLATCSPDGLEMKGTFSVAGENQSWAHPVVTGGRLYLRYDDTLYCYDVRPKAK
ncbi:MAG: PQQ-binding-like beta-propeller repeat protein [Phycisphaerae bacterium]|nr:PQQ-binding-like beta-propeller repeat protein [Phycisphaerae bacterium]